MIGYPIIPFQIFSPKSLTLAILWGNYWLDYISDTGDKVLPLRHWNLSQLKSCCSFRSVLSDFLWSHGLQLARLPGPSPSPGACSKSCPLSQGCHPTISSSVIPFSFCLLAFPALGSFLMSHLFATDSQSIGASASASVAPMNILVEFL